MWSVFVRSVLAVCQAGFLGSNCVVIHAYSDCSFLQSVKLRPVWLSDLSEIRRFRLLQRIF